MSATLVSRLISLFLGLLMASPAVAKGDIRGPVAAPIAEVNVVLGDISFRSEFGRAPGPQDDEDLRLRTHLAYVEDLLRAGDVSSLSPAQRAARSAILDQLHDYHVAGIFPRNRDLPGRRPCFVDNTGNVCAVGYLIEQTEGREVVEAINRGYQYASIAQIDAALLDPWLEKHGLTSTEAAMIQPFYGSLVEVSVQGGGGQIMATPAGTGPTLNSRGLVISVRVVDDGANPIAGYPYQDIWIGPPAGGTWPTACNGGMVADANTNANGETTFSGALAAGGWTDNGVGIYVAGVLVTHGVPVNLQVNSPDLTGDRKVDLADVGAFAVDFFNGYTFRSDLAWSASPTLNLADVGALAVHLGEVCP